METTRQNKIARLLQKELSEIFLLQTKSMHGVLVSVSAVRISPDLSIARVYLSIFPSDEGGELIKNINANRMKEMTGTERSNDNQGINKNRIASDRFNRKAVMDAAARESSKPTQALRQVVPILTRNPGV